MSLTETSPARRFAVFLAVILVAWATSSNPCPAVEQPPDEGEQTPARLLAAAKSWGYQLQKLDPDSLAASPYDMLVIDHSRDGKAARALTPEEVNKIRVKPDGERRIVLAYLSIGEAQTYRYYWKWYWGWIGVLSPRWLGSENPEWRGNYSVRYWQEGWQKIIFGGENSYLERIVNAGFDGIYLDGVDEYVDMVKEKRNARALMVAFVKAIAERGRALKPGFLVVPQNGEALLADASYRAVIDGIGKEDLLFGDDVNQQPNDPKSIVSDVGRLKLLTADHKPVFVVEYLDAPQEIERARRRLERYGFIPYFADRALDSMRASDVSAPDHAADKK